MVHHNIHIANCHSHTHCLLQPKLDMEGHATSCCANLIQCQTEFRWLCRECSGKKSQSQVWLWIAWCICTGWPGKKVEDSSTTACMHSGPRGSGKVCTAIVQEVKRWVAMCGNNILLISGISVYLSVNFSFNVKCSALSKEPYDQNTTELQWIPCADLIDMNFLICKKLVNLIYFSSWYKYSLGVMVPIQIHASFEFSFLLFFLCYGFHAEFEYLRVGLTKFDIRCSTWRKINLTLNLKVISHWREKCFDRVY